MSFRGDDSRRYGHIPPAQYPVAGTPQDQSGRRSSFNTGDDSSFFDQGGATRLHIPQYPAGSGRPEEELFITSPSSDHPPPPPRAGYPAQHVAQHIATTGFQSQYQPTNSQTPTAGTYNPQLFARSQSTSLPYHSHPSARYSASVSPTYNSPPTNYTPQAYNPAAYANTNSNQPQRQATVAGYNNYSYSYTSPSIQQGAFGQSPASTYGGSQSAQSAAAAQQGYEPALHSPAFAPSALSPQLDQSYSSTFSAQQYYTSHASNGASPDPSSAYSTPSTQAPYQAWSQMPPAPSYPADNSYGNRTSRSNSQESPLPSPPTQSQTTATTTGLQRHPTNAPLPSRPMEDVPEESAWAGAGVRDENGALVTQDSLIQDIVSDLGVSSHSQRLRPANGSIAEDESDRLRRYGSTASTAQTYASSGSAGVSRYTSNATTISQRDAPAAYDQWDEDDESDPEGAAGLLAMQDDMEDRRFGAISFPSFSGLPASPAPAQAPPRTRTHSQPQVAPVSQLSPAQEEPGTDSDFGVDLGLYGGGYAGNLQYGAEIGSPPAHATTFDGSRQPSQSQRRGSGYQQYGEASVDYGGTGGLQAPQIHRLSFDEGDEHVSIHSRQSGSDSPYKEDYPDMFYHPGLSSRPLPALPPGQDSNSMLTPSRDSYQPSHPPAIDTQSHYQTNSAAYQAQLLHQQHVERSLSLANHSSTPAVQAPARSRTDAAEERRRALRNAASQHQPPTPHGSTYEGYDTGTPSSLAAFDMITLPGRKRKFVPSKLTSADIKRCADPWALSGITAWIREMAEGEPDLKRKTIEEGVLRLFTAKVPTMNVADAELLSASVVDSMFAAGILIPEEEWVKFGAGHLSGVLIQLTGRGCYAQKLHENESLAPRLHDNGTPVRCYSHHCGRTLKKANLDALMSEDDVVVLDWATFHGVKAENIGDKSKKEIERQNVLHEIVTGEEDYMNQLDVLRLLYRDQLRAWQPPIIALTRMEKFIDAVFGRVDSVQEINKEHLLAQLKYRQKEQGPWIVGFSDLFREWIRKARPIYIDYCSSFPHASYLIRKEANRNLLFRQFLDFVREHKRSKRLEWTTFVKAPITRLQRYGLLLETVKKNMVGESEELVSLTKALEEIKAVTRECDDKVAEMTKKVELLELQTMLVLRPGFQSVLNLDHLGRKLLKQGELQRQGSKGVRWVDTHALLFDHYFILAKAVVTKDGRNDKKFDVSKEPIPMPLLFLESLNDDPVNKQKGITAPLTRTTVAGSSTQLNKINSNGVDRPGIEHSTTGSSIGSMSTVTRLGTNTSEDGRVIYPFRIKHLGHEIYTLYASSAADRAAWCQAIVSAKTMHAQALHAQNAEPFRLRVLSDGAFAYDSISILGRQPGVSIRGTPLDRAIREMEKVYGPGRGPPPVCRAQVNCATAFTAFGKSLIAVGTDYGVYLSDASNPRGWTKSVPATKVTQISVLEDFSVCLLITDKSLVSYPLDVVAPVSNFPAPAHDNPRRAPQRLAKDVAFFATARMKDRMLLFYKRKEGMHNTFKVLEPVFQKATEKKPRLFGGRRGASGSTESFRDYDEFYIPTECYSLNLFQSYIAVASAKGFELLTLDKKVTQSIPRDLTLPAIANIASRIKDQRPLGMFKLNDQEFLLTYEDCAVYVDKHGEISRTLIMEYSGKQKKAKAATMFGQYLVLFNEDYVEVRNAENGRLRQIIAGRDVRCLDYGFRGPTGNGQQPPVGQDSKGTVKICMSHPEVPGGQIVLEMLLNDGHAE